MEIERYCDLAIGLYKDAGKAASVIEKQAEILQREGEWKKYEVSRIDALVSELNRRARLTSVVEDQLSINIERVEGEIERGSYPIEHSPEMLERKKAGDTARQAIMAHRLFGELCVLIEEHNKQGGYGTEVLVDALQESDVLNYSGEVYKARGDHPRGKAACVWVIAKHNRKIRELQAQIAEDLPGVHAIIKRNWRGKKEIQGYELRFYIGKTMG